MLHPDTRLQPAWKFAQIGVLIFPLVPILGALGIFIALVLSWWQNYQQIVRRPVNWGLGALSLWLIFSNFFAFDRAAALLGLFNFLPFFVFFAAFSTLIQTHQQLRQLAKIIVITSIPVVILGYGQLLFNWATSSQLSAIIGWELVAKGNPPGRMTSVFMYANIFAGYLVIVFTLALGLWLENYQKITAQQKTSSLERQVKASKSHARSRNFIWLSLAVIGNFSALILTNSRNAWTIALVVSLAFAIYQRWRWLVAGVGAIATVILLAAFGPAPLSKLLLGVVPAFFWARLTDQLYPNRPVALLRTTQWQFAWNLTQQRPITGWGLRNFTPLYQARMQVWLGHPHNFFLMLTAETGILTAIFFCGWVGWILLQGIQLLCNWQLQHFNNRAAADGAQTIAFSYLLAFFACILFNIVDVTIFDLRLNTLGWLLLSAICGVTYRARAQLASDNAF